MAEAKVLLVGSYPPPHGGISVHVEMLARRLREGGATCRVLNLDPRAAPSPDYLTLRGGRDLLRIVRRHAREGFAVHLHTNGHGLKSWLIVLAVGLAARRDRAMVTLHSGMLPAYVQGGSFLLRTLVRLACARFSRIVCVNPEIRRALAAVGVADARMMVRAAFLPPPPPSGLLPADLELWLLHHAPILSSTLFFRPEYGLDVLLEAVARLRHRHPRLGCVVMGGGDRAEAEALVRRHGLAESVRLLGDVGHEECLKIIARSDLFVRPSRADGDSISVREALALGVRTVASDVGRRPAGVHLCRPGDVDGLVGTIERARVAPPPDPDMAGDDLWTGLRDLYGSMPHAQRNETARSHAPTVLRG